jgi:hypothetical protein
MNLKEGGLFETEKNTHIFIDNGVDAGRLFPG